MKHRNNASSWLDVNSSHVCSHFFASCQSSCEYFIHNQTKFFFFLIKRHIGFPDSCINLCVQSNNQQTCTSNNHNYVMGLFYKLLHSGKLLSFMCKNFEKNHKLHINWLVETILLVMDCLNVLIWVLRKNRIFNMCF